MAREGQPERVLFGRVRLLRAERGAGGGGHRQLRAAQRGKTDCAG